jgi:hypothetical protein
LTITDIKRYFLKIMIPLTNPAARCLLLHPYSIL